MLYRKFSTYLEEWSELEEKPALLIEGARQIGKTTLIREFAKNKYGKNFAEINFITTPSACSIPKLVHKFLTNQIRNYVLFQELSKNWSLILKNFYHPIIIYLFSKGKLYSLHRIIICEKADPKRPE